MTLAKIIQFLKNSSFKTGKNNQKMHRNKKQLHNQNKNNKTNESTSKCAAA